ncbi:hypothetical protein CVT24_002054 [Panaeolus cyanescens]|uniref:Fungal lipase-type domain-containing protein n=1 Tax=Panaeolus cyanescens TaxID=181874 RepID=A0A409WJC9_9AGAR|nr:hypothetical protein CVT24_002054 [Panaeolus cyanescens]
MFSKILSSLLLITPFFILAVTPPVEALGGTVQLNEREASIPSELFNELTWYFKYASSAYEPPNACLRPNGQTRVAQIFNATTATDGYIARDDEKKEIVVVFHVAQSPIHFTFNPLDIPLVQLYHPVGIDARVHAGFLMLWNSVAESVLNDIREQLVSRENYSIVVVGHSLGGALASIAAISIKFNFVTVSMRMFTYGQPRTGDASYAKLINGFFGSGKAYRDTHTTDVVPHIPSQDMDYVHHGVEYWISSDPASYSSITECDPDGEDKTCSNSAHARLSILVGLSHLVYMDIVAGTPFCF